MAIYGNMVGSSGGILGKTVEIISDDGVDLMGVVVDQETVLTAVASKDIREGTTAITDEGLVVGSKRIPAYETSRGTQLIMPNSDFSITTLSEYDKYDYTKLQCIITLFDTDINHSVSVQKTVIDDAVYDAGNTVKVADVTKDIDNKTIRLNIVNDSDNVFVIRYFTYKEED